MFVKLKNKFSGLSMFRKFFYIQIFALFIIIIFVCVPFGTYTSYVVVNEINNATSSAFLQMESSVKALCRECAVRIDSAFASAYNSSYLMTERKRDPQNIDDYLEFFRFKEQLASMNIIQNNNNALVQIYTDNPNLIFDDNHINQITDEVMASDWFKGACSDDKNIFVTDNYNHSNAHDSVAFVKRIKLDNEKYRYYIVLSVPKNVFYEELKDYQYDVYLALCDGTVLSKNQSAKDIKNLSEITDTEFSSVTEKLQTIYGKDSVVMINKLEKNGIMGEFIMCQEVNRSIFIKELRNVIFVMLFALVILCTVCIIIVYRLIKRILKRFMALKDAMISMEENNFTVSNYSAPEINDEISVIENQFVKMSQSISNLLVKVYRSEIENNRLKAENAEANINALQSQINPHFLFNVMESIRMKNIENGDMETANIISQFAYLIRKSVDWNNTPLITLRSELETINAYLKIQSYRMNDKFTYSFDIDEDILDCDIPRYTIQPLAENCICHGIEHMARKCSILISAKIYDDYFEVTVSDDGIGMKPEKLSEIRAMMGVRSLENIRKRLEYYYGEAYGTIQIDSEYDNGTTFRIKFPL